MFAARLLNLFLLRLTKAGVESSTFSFRQLSQRLAAECLIVRPIYLVVMSGRHATLRMRLSTRRRRRLCSDPDQRLHYTFGKVSKLNECETRFRWTS